MTIVERWCEFIMDAATAYFLKKYYPHVIKWWLVSYNPEVFRVWPSKAERKEALKKEALKKEAEKKQLSKLEAQEDGVDESAYNATTGSYSGLYGKKPVDAQTQEALNAIMNTTNKQNTVDVLLSGGDLETEKKKNNDDVVLAPEHDDIIKEANAIYERLMREAAEDEARKQAEIEAVRQQAEQELKAQNAG